MTVPLSVLDLAPIASGGTARESFEASVALAQAAERNGYRRVWYAEHHNMASIASSATSVLIAHVAAHTTSIRLGAGGVMLPNHSPLVIAEQFGTLATLHPDRIDLGLGRAPGSDQTTARAMRRDAAASNQFPEDVLELQAYLAGESRIPGVQAVPGAGTRVPLYILGSSLFGAQLAAALGLPYAFASHFAPAALEQAVATYRREFRPSEQLAEPYVLAAVNAVAADDAADAQQQLTVRRRAWVRGMLEPRPGRHELHRRAGRRLPAHRPGPPARRHAPLHGGRHRRRRAHLPRRLRGARGRRRAHRRLPVDGHDRPAPLPRADRAGRPGRRRLRLPALLAPRRVAPGRPKIGG